MTLANEPGAGGVGALVAQGVIVLFLLLLLALFLRTAFLMSTLWWIPLARIFGRARDEPADAPEPQSTIAVGSAPADGRAEPDAS